MPALLDVLWSSMVARKLIASWLSRNFDEDRTVVLADKQTSVSLIVLIQQAQDIMLLAFRPCASDQVRVSCYLQG